jgi:hypothetical protein
MSAAARALGIAWGLLLLAEGAYPDEAEDRAAAYVEKLGGRVTDQGRGGPVWRVDLHDTDVTDEGLKKLAGFRHLESLWLKNTKVSDAGLKNLAPSRS